METTDNDPTRQALQQCQIMLPLGRLLQLAPRFTKGLKMALTSQNPEPAPTFFSNLEEGPVVVDISSPTIMVIIKGKEITRTIIDGGSGVNVINQRTCDTLGIRDSEPCPFLLRMTDTSLVRPTRLIGNLEITMGGYSFQISAVVLLVIAPDAYPLLLGRPWLRTTHIKKNWQKNIIGFRRGKTKVRVPTQERATANKQLTPLYAIAVNLSDGLPNEEVDQYLAENPRTIPLFENPRTIAEPAQEVVRELR